MGVPAFYRWLSQKYPKIVKDVIEQHPEWVNGTEIPVDTSEPNPNGMEFDNLYLDMNGIIHPCFHPEDRPAPTTEAEVFINIFDYIDRLFSIVRPRKLLYMAIDGVAPRAKMNQQRSRRFRAAQDAAEAAKERARLEAELEREQGIKLPKRAQSEVFDSNVITPGTPFMDRLATALQYYVHLKLNSDPGWKGIEVILSDSNVPGEGEHKAMQYVRQMRGRPGWNANTRHCVYGLDADLIMLALATHEPHFVILREVIMQQNAPQDPKSQARAQFFERNDPNAPMPVAKRENKPEVARKPYQFLLISILREYLALELNVPNLPFKFDPERVYDDFVFMCFFVGNDFLPHMPTLDIREGAIELMMRVYKMILPNLGGFLTDGVTLNLERAEMFIQAVGQYEDAIFQKRMRELRRQKERVMRQRQQADNDKFRRQQRDSRRADEAAPSAAYVQAAIAVGDVRSARSAARPALDFKGSKDALKRMEEEDTSRALQQQIYEGRALGPVAPPQEPAPAIDNKSAAQKLREKLAARKGAAGAAAAEAAAEQPAVAEEETRGEPSAKRARHAADADVADAAAAVGAAAEEAQQPAAEAAAVDEAPAAADGDGAASGEAVDAAADEGAAAAEGAAAPAPAAAGDVEDDITFAELQNMRREEIEDEEVLDVIAGGAGVGIEEEGAEAEEEEEAAGASAPVAGLELELTEEQKQKNKEAADAIKARLKDFEGGRSDKFDTMFADEQKIRLDEEGWKARYYQEKLGVPAEAQEEVVREVVKSYVQGLAWVMAYYYNGCCSWQWYYPFHYAPFASDLKDLSSLTIEFEEGEPFSPFNQLMGVLPAASAHTLPQCFRWLFTSPDSPILDFYPTDFAVDMNGKRFAWQGVALLPFIDEARLMDATSKCLDKLNPEERRRNSRRMELLYIHATHGLAPALYELEAAWGHLSNEEERAKQAIVEMDPVKSKGMFGSMLLCAGEVCPAVIPVPFPDIGDEIPGNQVLCAAYRLPPPVEHLSRILPGTIVDPSCLTELDKPVDEPLWHEKHGFGGRQGNSMMRNSAYVAGDAARRTIENSLGGRGGMGGPPHHGGYHNGPGGYPNGPGHYGGPPPHMGGMPSPGAYAAGPRYSSIPPPSNLYGPPGGGRGGPPPSYRPPGPGNAPYGGGGGYGRGNGAPPPQAPGYGGGGGGGYAGNNPYAVLQRPSSGGPPPAGYGAPPQGGYGGRDPRGGNRDPRQQQHHQQPPAYPPAGGGQAPYGPGGMGMRPVGPPAGAGGGSSFFSSMRPAPPPYGGAPAYGGRGGGPPPSGYGSPQQPGQRPPFMGGRGGPPYGGRGGYGQR